MDYLQAYYHTAVHAPKGFILCRSIEHTVLDRVHNFALRLEPIVKRVTLIFTPDFVDLVCAYSDSSL
jgi:hypothetical protein